MAPPASVSFLWTSADLAQAHLCSSNQMVANGEASPESRSGKRLYHWIEKATKCCGLGFQSFIHSALEKLSHGYNDNEGSLAHVHLLIFYLLFSSYFLTIVW